MTAVLSNVGDGPVWCEAHTDERGMVHATLSSAPLTVTWGSMTRDERVRFAAALHELCDALDALDALIGDET